MEKWIERNQHKIFLLCTIFIMWCFYSVVHEGGSVIPRISRLENSQEEMQKDQEEMQNMLITHIHYYNGKMKPIK